MLFDNTKLEMAMRRRSAKAEEGCETSKFIRKRSTIKKVGVAECFLCEMECNVSELREAMMIQLKERLKVGPYFYVSGFQFYNCQKL
jgi:uncharacterized Fe-S radical SAM superfamily protein PflX